MKSRLRSRRWRCIALAVAVGMGVTCAATVHADNLPPIQPVAHVDLKRFMGRWYLIGAIPTSYGKNAWNAVETYKLEPDGNIATGFSFHEGAADGPVKTIQSTGYVQPGTGNAVWAVQVFWFFKAQYIVAYLKPDYSTMIVARDKRDYTWVFSRTPTVSKAERQRLRAKVKALGYDMAEYRNMPQVHPQAGSAGTATSHPTLS